MRHGAPDPAKRLLTESYSLYQPKGGQVRWDGRQLVAHGVIAAQSGFSIVAQLQESGVRVDDSSREPLILLKKVAMQRAVAAALQTGVAERTLAAHPQLQATLERITPPWLKNPTTSSSPIPSIRPTPISANRCGTRLRRCDTPQPMPASSQAWRHRGPLTRVPSSALLAAQGKPGLGSAGEVAIPWPDHPESPAQRRGQRAQHQAVRR